MEEAAWKATPFDAKVVLVGDSGVGKTSISLRYCHSVFHEFGNPTIGASFLTKTLVIDRNVKVKLQIWDTAGQERFRSLAPMYYRQANAALLVFNVGSMESFVAMQEWARELRSNISVLADDVDLTIVGNKCDIPADEREVKDEGKSYAESIGATYIETSAKENIGIDELFFNIAKRLHMQRSKKMPVAPKSPGGNVDIGKKPPEQTEQSSCC